MERARARKPAAWARVTVSSGQKRSLAGGLHPKVMPAAASRLIAGSRIWPLSSMKASAVVSGKGRDLATIAAICALVSTRSGQ